MKRKTLIMLTAALLIASGISLTGITAYADSVVKSKGNFVLRDETMAIYSSDIDYLQSEIEALLNELHN